ncbi:FAD-dependent oxidoreductase [Chryseobacterium phosphatilyticum]|uniref:NADH:ubiquinone reductase (non-electrogenic) n=1 Tax=Chryseobacterium phosphatilyticum TaxID=475075 RepID=A0A316XI17_9FLAO|nr:NAD(P)/FAD-dependent oxidoreductase [Chryseobacterium phosphatilyticum]PWN72436.1 FAD-dependent oxidoreductase [Chryseobacterium phosphatilyticum]
MKKIIIVGGGFAGTNLANKLAKNKNFDITLVDINNYNFFPPLIYQVATAFIEPSNISYPFRKMFQGKENVEFHLGSLVMIHQQANIVETDKGYLKYDYLVLAMGTETNFFGNKNIEAKAFPMKNINDAAALRNHILLSLEKATITSDIEEEKKLRNIVIAGGGATGVEVAGMLSDMSRNIMSKDYPHLVQGVGKIYLIDGSNALLGPMSQKAQQEALKVLKGRGVDVILNTLVNDYNNDIVTLGNNESIPTATLIWASGVIARQAPGLPESSITRGRRIMVDEYNRVSGTENIFALGDQCFQTSDKNYPNGHPQLAQIAIQQGVLLADNLIRLEEKRALKPFSYHNKGSMAAIAKFKSVVDFPKGGFMKGFMAWLTWLFIHLIPIAGSRNKFKLATNWVVSFMTDDPTLRLILGAEKKDPTP